MSYLFLIVVLQRVQRGVEVRKRVFGPLIRKLPQRAVNDNSFTKNLIEELKALSSSSYNVVMLHARLMRPYRKPGPGTRMLLTEPWRQS